MKKMAQIRRVTKLQKQIINQILDDGLNAYYYDSDLMYDRAIQFCVTEVDIEACLAYVEEKFKFFKV
jgi:GTPase Era involved in 16S rRNA processing